MPLKTEFAVPSGTPGSVHVELVCLVLDACLPGCCMAEFSFHVE